MHEISERNYELIRAGLKHTGDYMEAYYYSEERFYVDEAAIIFEFLKWCAADPVERGFGNANYNTRFEEFLCQK